MAGCPKCAASAKVVESRYLGEQYLEHRSIAGSELKKMKCRSAVCSFVFIRRKDWPLNDSLEPTIVFNEDFIAFHNAIKTKPGIPPGKTTISEFSDIIHRGDHIQILERYKIAFFGQAVAV
jgi:hypothetical protein